MPGFHDTPVTLENGANGEIIAIPSANPVNFHQALTRPDEAGAQTIFGQLFVPTGTQLAAVIVVPGSLGVAESHLSHCAALVDAGIAAFAIDPFGARSVTSTVANQAQYSFAASSWDVLAAARALRQRAEVDPNRIGAQGHSRGGTAVVNAAVSCFPDAMQVEPLCAVYGAYPWCGFQFLRPVTGKTRIRSIVGDQDEWCLAQQVQAYMQAMRLAGGDASVRIVPGAHHSFDRSSPVSLVAEASVAPSAPTTFLTDDGCYLHPVEGQMPEATTDRELMLYGIKAGYGVRGARLGSDGDQAAVFRDDMMRFWTGALA